MSWSDIVGHPDERTAMGQVFDAGIRLALRMCVKTRKGRAEDIIGKNMTTMEPAVLAAHVKKTAVWQQVEVAVGQGNVPAVAHILRLKWPSKDAELTSLFALLPEGNTVDPPLLRSVAVVAIARYLLLPELQGVLDGQRELLRACAYAAALDERRRTILGSVPGRDPVLTLKFLRPLVKVPGSYDEVRRWFYHYWVNNVADNGFKKRALALGTVSLVDFITVRRHVPSDRSPPWCL